MKKLLMVMLITAFIICFMFIACINQTLHQDTTFLDGYQFEEVWSASIHAVNDIGFTVDSLDKASGFISAASGTHIGQDAPPRLTIMISETRGQIHVDCKVLQMEQYVDILGHGKRTIRNFMTALNVNLNH
jgi:hypothetical protein